MNWNGMALSRGGPGALGGAAGILMVRTAERLLGSTAVRARLGELVVSRLERAVVWPLPWNVRRLVVPLVPWLGGTLVSSLIGLRVARPKRWTERRRLGTGLLLGLGVAALVALSAQRLLASESGRRA